MTLFSERAGGMTALGKGGGSRGAAPRTPRGGAGLPPQGNPLAAGPGGYTPQQVSDQINWLTGTMGGGLPAPRPDYAYPNYRTDGYGDGGGGWGGGGGGGAGVSTADQQEIARAQMAQIWLDSATTDQLHGNNIGMYGLDTRDQQNIIKHANQGKGFAGQNRDLTMKQLGLADKQAALKSTREQDMLNSETIAAGAQHAAGYERDRGYINTERSQAEQGNQIDRSRALVEYNTQIADLDNRIRNANTEMERIGLQRKRSEIERDAKKKGFDLDAKILGLQTKELFATPTATGGMSGR